MPVIAPAQTNLRVMPTAAVPDAQLFTQIPSATAGMQLFEQAAKLPLLMEQIKMEKYRQKAEKAKLDFAEQQAKWQSDNFERINQQQQTLAALQQEQLRADITAKQISAEADRLRAAASLAELTAVPTSTGVLAAEDMSTPAEASTPAARPAAPANAPAAGWSIMPQKGGYGTAPETVAPSAATPAPSLAARAKAFLTTKVPALPAGVDVNEAANAFSAQEADRLVRQQFGDKVPLKVYREKVVDARGKALEQLRPKTDTFTFDLEGIPMKAPALMVGNRPVAITGEPFVDVKGLHERIPTQKVVDEAVAKDLGEMLTGAGDRALQTNLKNLGTAKDILQNSDTATGAWVSILPDALRARIPGLSKGIVARDAVRTVVQQTLRQTLGAQFARIEGEMMMERAFDPRMDEKENLRRVNLLIDETLRYAAVKSSAAEYMRTHGTMYGYKGENLDAAADAMANRLNLAFAEDDKAEKPAPGAPESMVNRPAVRGALEAILGKTVKR